MNVEEFIKKNTRECIKVELDNLGQFNISDKAVEILYIDHIDQYELREITSYHIKKGIVDMNLSMFIPKENIKDYKEIFIEGMKREMDKKTEKNIKAKYQEILDTISKQESNKNFYCINCKQDKHFRYEEESIAIRGFDIENGDIDIGIEDIPIISEVSSTAELGLTIVCLECETRFILPEKKIKNLSEIKYVTQYDKCRDAFYMGTEEEKEKYNDDKWEEL